MTDAPKKSKQRRWAPEDRARVLAVLTANAGNISRTSRETGVPQATIRLWRDNPDDAAPAELRDRARRDLAVEVDQVRWLYLERARDRKAVQTTSGFYAVQAFQKLTEAHQLLTGGPTARIEATEWGQLMRQIREGRQAAMVPASTPERVTHAAN